MSLGQLRPTPELAADRSQVIDRIANIEVEGRMILLLNPRELLDRAETGSSGGHAEIIGPSRRTHVIRLLVVDDSPLIRRLLGERRSPRGRF